MVSGRKIVGKRNVGGGALKTEITIEVEYADDEFETLSPEQSLWLAVIERKLFDYGDILHRGTLRIIGEYEFSNVKRSMWVRQIQQFILFDLPAICDDCGFCYETIFGIFERVRNGEKPRDFPRRLDGPQKKKGYYD